MELNNLPRHISRYDYLVTKTKDVIKENEIEDYKSKSEHRFLEEAYNKRKEDLISKKRQSYYDEYVDKIIKQYASTSYLLEVKDNVEEIEDEFKKCFLQFSTMANNTLRDVKKDRKNDYNDVLKSIQDRLNNITGYIEIDETEDMLEEVLQDLEDNLEEETQEPKNRLEKYIDNKYNELYNKAKICVTPFVKNKMNEYLDKNSNTLEEELSDYMMSYKKNHLKDFRYDLDNSIINIFDTVLAKYKTNINFVDDGKYLYLVNVNSFTTGTEYTFSSGRGLRCVGKAKHHREDTFVRYGDTFTLVLGSKEKVEY